MSIFSNLISAYFLWFFAGLAFSNDLDEKLVYKSPGPNELDLNKFYIIEHFDDIQANEKNWIKSKAKKDDLGEKISKYDGSVFEII